eukprot:750010-Hanusia_phi.AAC.1
MENGRTRIKQEHIRYKSRMRSREDQTRWYDGGVNKRETRCSVIGGKIFRFESEPSISESEERREEDRIEQTRELGKKG